MKNGGYLCPLPSQEVTQEIQSPDNRVAVCPHHVLGLQLAGDALQLMRLGVVKYDREFGVGVTVDALDS
jgi:hypothetical protein